MTPTRYTFFLAALLALSLGGFWTTGCGSSGLSYTVDESKLKDTSRQGQIWIYDAENDIVVAFDQLDEATDDLQGIRRRLRQAEQALETAEKRNSRMGAEMAETWIKYLEAMEDWAKARISSAKVGVLLAKAMVELAKAQVINREDLLGGKGFAMKDYQEQYNQLKNEFEQERKTTAQLRKDARKLEAKWWQIRQRFVAQTGDYDSGLWIE
jgi:chromosome segregation ATPase